MVDHPYYEAEMTSGGNIGDTPLKDAINEHGIRKRERAIAAHGDMASDAYTEVVVDSWAGGPLLYLERFDTDGEREPPTLGDGLCKAVAQAGYAPWGFRPERDYEREHTGRWMWYLRPIEDVQRRPDEGAVFDSTFAIKTPEGEFEYLRNDDGHLVTFDNRANAQAVADQVANDEIIEVPQ